MGCRTAAFIEQSIPLLLKCRKARNSALSMQVHTQMAFFGLEAHAVLGNYLVPIYTECGCMLDARYVFDTMVHPNEFSWTSIIQGHVEHGELVHALTLFQSMQKSMVQPSNYTLVAVVKACSQLKVLDTGLRIHMQIVKEGLDGDPYVANTLLDMYARCGSLSEAHKVFDLLPIRIVVSWNILITGYLDYGLGGEKALECFDQMQSKDVLPNVITFICILKACGSLRAITKGEEIHTEVVKGGVERDLSLGTTLVNMYAKCGLVVEAQSVINQLQVSSNVPWNALITGYVENNSGEKALECMDQMQCHGIPPNAVTFVCSLKACIITQDLRRGQDVHAEVVKAGLDGIPTVGNSLTDMYAKCGAILETRDVFDKLPDRSVVSWTALIAGYAEYGFNEEALICLKMCSEELSPDAAMYVCSLRACGSLETASMGQELHGMILKKGLEKNLYVGNMLVDMYIRGGSLADGQGVFNCLPSPNLVSWNILIAGIAEHGLGMQSLVYYNRMQLEGMFPDVTTFICTLKACTSMENANMGQQIHAAIIKTGLESAGFVGKSIVDMYAKCGSLLEAQHVFDLLPERSIASWNSIITGFSEHGCGENVLKLVEQMRMECFALDGTTYVYSLKACGSLKSSIRGQKQHTEIIIKGLEEHPYIGSALVDMYANCGWLVEAQQLIDGLAVRNVVVWTALITGYAEHGLGVEALECLERMLVDGVLPNIITYACILKVCGNLSAIVKGEELHSRIAKEGLLGFSAKTGGKVEGDMLPQTLKAVRLEDTEVLLRNALIDMYCKCGSMVDAQNVFDEVLAVDLATWNALLTGYARQGDCELVFCLFDRVRAQGVKPNEVMLLTVFSVCSHGGLVSIGHKCFESMKEDYCICPTLEHYNCLVDLLSRAGQLQEAITVLENMPFEPDLVTWSTLLGACRNWGDVDLGRQSFEWVARLDEGNAAAFIVMSNIYAEADMWQDAKSMEALKRMLKASLDGV